MRFKIVMITAQLLQQNTWRVGRLLRLIYLLALHKVFQPLLEEKQYIRCRNIQKQKINKVFDSSILSLHEQNFEMQPCIIENQDLLVSTLFHNCPCHSYVFTLHDMSRSDIVREAPFWNVLFPYGHYTQIALDSPPFPSVKRAPWSTFIGPYFFICFFTLPKWAEKCTTILGGLQRWDWKNIHSQDINLLKSPWKS